MEKQISNKLNPYYLTGFVDSVGEGCFSVLFIRSRKMKFGWIIRMNFQIKVHIRNKELLEKIRDTLGSGVIVNNSTNSCILKIVSLSEIINTIIPHFEKYPLMTKTREEFELFKQVALIMKKKEHLSSEGFHKILSLKAAMRNGLTGVLAENFPNTLPESPIFASTHISLGDLNIDPNWLVGFTEGKGSFKVDVQESPATSGEGKAVKLNFQILQNERDKELLTLIILYLNCGTLKTEGGSTSPNKIITVTNFENISNIIIPFFQKYPLQGIKRLDFDIFIKVAELIKTKARGAGSEERAKARSSLARGGGQRGTS